MSSAVEIRPEWPVATVAVVLSKSSRWVKERVKDGTFTGYKHSATDFTVDVLSVVEWQQASRVRRP